MSRSSLLPRNRILLLAENAIRKYEHFTALLSTHLFYFHHPRTVTGPGPCQPGSARHGGDTARPRTAPGLSLTPARRRTPCGWPGTRRVTTHRTATSWGRWPRRARSPSGSRPSCWCPRPWLLSPAWGGSGVRADSTFHLLLLSHHSLGAKLMIRTMRLQLINTLGMLTREWNT